MSKKATKYHECPDCEASFIPRQLVDGKIPPHTFCGRPCGAAAAVVKAAWADGCPVDEEA